MKFKLKKNFNPAGDQPKAIDELVNFLALDKKHQVLLGATGTGKTFTIANVIERTQKSALIIVHNKTLAMQVFGEMKSFFPENRVEYYVSFFDYYRPEAYKPSSDVYLEKKTQRNADIEKMRMNALNALSTEKSVIVVASVASIYGCLDPTRYQAAMIDLVVGDSLVKEDFIKELFSIGYTTEKKNLRVSSDEEKHQIEIDREEDSYFRIEFLLTTGVITSLSRLWKSNAEHVTLEKISIPPIQYILEKEERMRVILKEIESDLQKQKTALNLAGKFLEAQRLEKRIGDDLLDLKEFGFCSGVENYSSYFDGRGADESPFVLLDFFKKGNFITVVEESHITVPQIKAMYNTDRNRKKTLVDYGFRLPSALDNRPLSFEEFLEKVDDVIYISATPGPFELEKVNNEITEQIIRPTGLIDPEIEIRSSIDQIKDMIKEINIRAKRNEKVLIYALTINMSEDIAAYLQSQGVRAVFIHSRLDVFERYQAIASLRRGVYDVIVGINLLKEGIDIPEVSLVCIIDADKPGFLRDVRSLIQIVGRAARNQNGKVIFYASHMTSDMRRAIEETERRRKIQVKHNLKYNITPTTVVKELGNNILLDSNFATLISEFKSGKLSPEEVNDTIKDVEKNMKRAVKEFKFDKAIELRNLLFDLKDLVK